MKRESNPYNDLRARVEEVNGNRCPCCGTYMRHPPRQRRAQPVRQPRDTRTRGHDHPVAEGGNSLLWVYICRGCNGDQGAFTFEQWCNALKHVGDPRAERVLRLVEMIGCWTRASGIGRFE